MSEKRLRLKVNTIEEYLSIFDGIFNLTETEKTILGEFIKVEKTLDRNRLDINPFSTDMKKKVSDRLGRDDFNTLNNYIKNFKDKKAILSTDDGYRINPVLMPKENESRIIINLD